MVPPGPGCVSPQTGKTELAAQGYLGNNAEAYSEEIYRCWGTYPYRFHACTEAGIIALQNWTRQGMTFIPNSNFYEFIPEEEWARSRSDIFYAPRTVLLPDVRENERYELVFTNFHGMPFIRYRSGHLIRITALEDKEAKIYLPQMVFETHSSDLIEFNKFTRISEKSLRQAISLSGLHGEDWVACKEMRDGKPRLHLYLELDRDEARDDPAERIQKALIKVDSGYHDLAMNLEISPLRVTILIRGSFKAYARAHQDSLPESVLPRPVRMNATREDIAELLGLNAEKVVRAG
jgi:hypothetical protein